jgi:putative NADH-flavin reductase
MNLFVLGATGGTGRALLDQALRRGHRVTAFVRSPEKLGAPRDGVTVEKGDPCDAGSLRAAMKGHDAVATALGPPGTGRTTILGTSACGIVAAMQGAGVRRLLVVSAAVLFENAGILVALFRHTLLRNVAKDSGEMERIVMASELEWTIARPPRLTNGALTQRYAVADGRMPGTGLTISRADVAHFLLEELERGEHVRRIVGMASRR